MKSNDQKTKKAVISILSDLEFTFAQAKEFLKTWIETWNDNTKIEVIYELAELWVTFRDAKDFLKIIDNKHFDSNWINKINGEGNRTKFKFRDTEFEWIVVRTNLRNE